MAGLTVLIGSETTSVGDLVMTAIPPIPEPGALLVGADGSLGGRTGGYEKRLGEMTGVYRDEAALASATAELGADHLVYQIGRAHV